MIKENIKYAIRNIRRQKIYSFINIVGLASGMAVTFIILYFILQELSFDTHHKNYDNIYAGSWINESQTLHYGATPFVFASALKENYGHLMTVAQVSDVYGNGIHLRKGDSFIPLKNYFYADPEIFDIFSFELIEGNLSAFENNMYSVLISESAKQQYFPDTVTPLGKILEVKQGQEFYRMEIAGILKDAPLNSHFRPDFVAPKQLMVKRFPAEFINMWGFNNPNTYVSVKPGTNPKSVREIVKYFNEKIVPEERKAEYDLIPLSDLHLYTSEYRGYFGAKGDINKIFVFGAIALLTLVIACINFINLSTARAAARAKEIGIRKVVGATRRELRKYILLEAVITAFAAFPLSLVLVELIQPFASQYFERNLQINYFENFPFVLMIILIVVIVGFLSGLYNAIVLSAFNPVLVLKSKVNISSSRSVFRKALLTFQFFVFTGLIICSLIITGQMEYIKNSDSGYESEQVLVTNLPDNKFSHSCLVLKEKLKNYSQIQNVTIASLIPTSDGNWLFDDAQISSRPEEKISIQIITSDESYLETLGIQIIAGRNYSKREFGSDAKVALINELAVQELGFENPVGESLEILNSRYEIIGVVKNFKTISDYEPMEPLMIVPSENYLHQTAIKITGREIKQTIDKLRATWLELFPDSPLTYSFLDEEFEKIYKSDLLFGNLIFFFTLIAVFVAVIGLAGMASFTASQKISEIGIRKVLGASIQSIIKMLTKEVLYISFVSSVLAGPIAYFIMTSWLENFAYKFEITPAIFLIAFASTFFVSFITVGFHAAKAATANPIDSLRDE